MQMKAGEAMHNQMQKNQMQMKAGETMQQADAQEGGDT